MIMRNERDIGTGIYLHQGASPLKEGGGKSKGDTPLLFPLYRLLHSLRHRAIAPFSEGQDL